MKKQICRSLVIAALLAAAAPFLTGCLAVVAGGAAAGTVAYVMGDLKAVVDANTKKVRKAIEAAGKSIGLHQIEAKSDEMVGTYKFRNGQDAKITIDYKRITGSTTELKIRVGVFGDEPQAEQILEAIRKELGK